MKNSKFFHQLPVRARRFKLRTLVSILIANDLDSNRLFVNIIIIYYYYLNFFKNGNPSA